MADVKKRPYSPSWVDRLIDWIEELPIPSWLFFILLYLFAAIGLHIAIWLNQSRPWGEISIAQIYGAVWLPAVLIIIHNTDLLAKQAIRRFAPLIKDHRAELDEIQYQMTSMPARPVLALFTVAAVFITIGSFQDPTLIFYELPAGPVHPLSWAFGLFFGVTSYSLAPVMLYHAVRQLALITKAYELVDEVNVFHQQPLYAFSGLTMRTAMFFIFLVYLTYAGEYIYEASASEEAINLVLSVIIVPLSLMIVLLPLWGIHERLLRSREGVLEENSVQIASTRAKLYTAIEKQSYSDVNGLDTAMASLYKERDQLQAIPTWPWAPGTLRNFLSAVLIPMMLWLLQTLAARFL
jgi:hypothetical protein